MQRSIAWILKVKKHLLRGKQTQQEVHTPVTNNDSCKEVSAVKPNREQPLTNPKLLSVADMKEAEMAVIGYIQSQAFPEEVKTLQELQTSKDSDQQSKKSQGDCIVRKTSHISKLNPFMKDGHVAAITICLDATTCVSK